MSSRLRLVRSRSSPSTRAMTRTPSHFTSVAQSSPRGIALAGVASIGGIALGTLVPTHDSLLEAESLQRLGCGLLTLSRACGQAEAVVRSARDRDVRKLGVEEVPRPLHPLPMAGLVLGERAGPPH